jgi:hypothetical protein
LAPKRQKHFSKLRINRHWLARRFGLGLVNLAEDNTSLNHDVQILPIDITPSQPQDFTDSQPQTSGDEDNRSVRLFQFV